jgi:hypothetical protein
MADSTIPNSFKVAFDDQCKLVYQDRGGRLRQCVRTKQTDGTEEKFFRMGKGEAKDKERGAKVPRLNLDRIPTTVKLSKKYASEAIDDLDTKVQAYDEMPKVAESVVMACTRAQDNMIKSAIETKAAEVGNVINHNNTGWTMNKVKMLHRHFGRSHIFDAGTGRNFVFTTSVGFEDLLDINQMSNRDFIGPDEMPFRMAGMRGFRWYGFEWYTWDALTVDDEDICSSIAFNSECVAFAYAADLTTKIYFDEDTDEHVAKAKFYAGAGVIDETGIMVIQTAEEAVA